MREGTTQPQATKPASIDESVGGAVPCFPDKKSVFRFAPSPNGKLHLGHAYSALLNYDWAQRAEGTFKLRIEDIDIARSRAEHVAAIKQDLLWLGIKWEDPPMHQSDRFQEYRVEIDRLKKLGLLYPCFASRQELTVAAKAADSGCDPDGAPLYPGLWRNRKKADVDDRMALGQPYAMRLHMKRALTVAMDKLGGKALTYTAWDGKTCCEQIVADPLRWGDAVIVRKDIPASYHLAVVIDDAAQGITHVVRGADLHAASDLHCLLQVLLDLPRPIYHHHRLILGDDGRKLSKSQGDEALACWRQRGQSGVLVRQRLGLSGEKIQEGRIF